MDDANLWSVAWAMFAVASGTGLTVAAIALVRRTVRVDFFEYEGGYNALAPVIAAKDLTKI
jgi:hypothetical protein